MAKARARRGDRRYSANRPAGVAGGNPLKRAILAACARLGLDDEARRALQQEVIGKASLTQMTTAELVRLRDHLNRGWKRAPDPRPHMAKIRALWWSLYWLGVIRRVDDDALEAFVKRQTGVEKLAFLGHNAAPAVIEALKAWLEREGVSWWSADQIAGVVGAGHPEFDAPLADRHAVLDAIAVRLDRADLMHRLALTSWLGAKFNRPGNRPWDFTAEELDEGIRTLGKKLRRHLEATDGVCW